MLTCTSCGGLTPIGASRACLHCEAPLRQPSRAVLRIAGLLGPVGAVLLAACYGGPGMYGRTHKPTSANGAVREDRDQDGAYGPWECPYHQPACEESLSTMPVPADLDCDDHDPTRYPGAADPDGDGIDQNCDGVDGWRDPALAPTPASAPTYATPPPDVNKLAH